MELLALLLIVFAFGALRAGALVPPPLTYKKYIIVMKMAKTDRAISNHVAWVDKLHAESLYRATFASGPPPKGRREPLIDIGRFRAYTGEFTEAVFNLISRSNDVDISVESKVIHLQKDADPKDEEELSRRGAEDLPKTVNRQDAPWNLARISHETPDGSGYVYRENAAGEGMVAYVIDEGIDARHSEFGGRVHRERKWNLAGGDALADPGGHGTAVASIIGGATCGVQPKATLISVKPVQNNWYETEDLIHALNWIYHDAKDNGSEKKSVVNFSLMFNDISPEDQEVTAKAFTALHDKGLLVVVAAGNQDTDQLGFIANLPMSLTVGASTAQNKRWIKTNYGPRVDIMAPGMKIEAADISNDKTKARTGTSYAAPHVAGLALYLIQVEGYKQPDQLKDKIIDLSIKDALKFLKPGTPNRLAYNNGGKPGLVRRHRHQS